MFFPYVFSYGHNNPYITPSVKKNESDAVQGVRLIFCKDKSPTKEFCKDANRPKIHFSQCKSYSHNTVVPELVVPELVNPVNPVNLVCSKTYKYGCEICKYPVISPNSKCKHNYCNYCLTTRIFYVGDKCIFCVRT